MNRVLLPLTLAVMSALAWLPFVHFAPNRMRSGVPHDLWALAGQGFLSPALVSGLLLALAVLAWRWPIHVDAGRAARPAWPPVLAALLTLCLLFWLFFTLGAVAQQLAADSSAAARVKTGSAFWLALLLSFLILLDAGQRLLALKKRPLLAWLSLLLAVLCLFGWLGQSFAEGYFDQLSLIKEYRNQQDRFATALRTHFVLVLAALLPTLLIGLPLGWLTWRYRGMNGAIFAVLNFLQTIPSIALFALLIAPLSALSQRYPVLQEWHLGGIGFAPALIALTLYTLLPLTRNVYAGLAGVPAGVLEAARAMGMSRWQILQKILYPLALPVILSGLRIVVVQSIGLTVVAALIGAGGLGVFVWEGLGQYALDLVLLGALPTIFCALLADLFMQWLLRLSRPAGGRIDDRM